MTDTSEMANVEASMASPKSIVTMVDAALVREASSIDRVGNGRCTVEDHPEGVGGGVAVAGGVRDAAGGDLGSHIAVGDRRQGEREGLVGR